MHIIIYFHFSENIVAVLWPKAENPEPDYVAQSVFRITLKTRSVFRNCRLHNMAIFLDQIVRLCHSDATLSERTDPKNMSEKVATFKGTHFRLPTTSRTDFMKISKFDAWRQIFGKKSCFSLNSG